jgi:hypothetical protein
MEIEPVLRELIDLTVSAGRALADDDLARCAALLDERGRAMRRLDAPHEGDVPPPSRTCQELLQRFRHHDAELQRALRRRRDEIGGELADLKRPPAHEQSAPPLCLDRRA